MHTTLIRYKKVKAVVLVGVLSTVLSFMLFVLFGCWWMFFLDMG